MIEIPESAMYASQLNETVGGRCVVHAEDAHSPHKFAWYWGADSIPLWGTYY